MISSGTLYFIDSNQNGWTSLIEGCLSDITSNFITIWWDDNILVGSGLNVGIQLFSDSKLQNTLSLNTDLFMLIGDSKYMISIDELGMLTSCNFC